MMELKMTRSTWHEAVLKNYPDHAKDAGVHWGHQEIIRGSKPEMSGSERLEAPQRIRYSSLGRAVQRTDGTLLYGSGDQGPAPPARENLLRQPPPRVIECCRVARREQPPRSAPQDALTETNS